jgi:hypothetical protein
MDQRREPRFRVNQPVTVTVLSEPRRRIGGSISNASGRGLGVVMEARVEPGAALRIELEDAILLGEAIYCRSEGDTHFLGVELDQMLVGLTELGRHLAASTGEIPVERPAIS